MKPRNLSIKCYSFNEIDVASVEYALRNLSIKCYSFNEIDVASVEYALSLSPEQRLDIAQYLREQFYKVKGIKHKRLNKKIVLSGNFNKNEKRKGL